MRVAVYGTLRVGEGNWEWALKNTSEHLGTFRVGGFGMCSNGSFPYAYENAGEITVDLFKIDVRTLNQLDSLEGYPSHYDRKTIQVAGEEAWIYFTRRLEVQDRCQQIPSGDWLQHRRNRFVA